MLPKSDRAAAIWRRIRSRYVRRTLPKSAIDGMRPGSRRLSLPQAPHGASAPRKPGAHSARSRPTTRRRAPASLSSVHQAEILNDQANRQHHHASFDHEDVDPPHRRRVQLVFRLVFDFEHDTNPNCARLPAHGQRRVIGQCSLRQAGCVSFSCETATTSLWFGETRR